MIGGVRRKASPSTPHPVVVSCSMLWGYTQMNSWQSCHLVYLGCWLLWKVIKPLICHQANVCHVTPLLTDDPVLMRPLSDQHVSKHWTELPLSRMLPWPWCPCDLSDLHWPYPAHYCISFEEVNGPVRNVHACTVGAMVSLGGHEWVPPAISINTLFYFVWIQRGQQRWYSQMVLGAPFPGSPTQVHILFYSPHMVSYLIPIFIYMIPCMYLDQTWDMIIEWTRLRIHSNDVTYSNLQDTLIYHTTMCRDSIHLLYISGHVTLWCFKVVLVVWNFDVWKFQWPMLVMSLHRRTAAG